MKIKIEYESKRIADISEGDIVISKNMHGNVLRRVVNKYEVPVIAEEQVKVETTLGNFITSLSHRMMTNYGYMTIYSIIMSDKEVFLQDEKGNDVSIHNISPCGEVDEVFYDLFIEDDHCYYIGGEGNMLLSHNSATVYCPWWHYEIEDVLVLKNNAGTDDNRVRKLDYAIQFCKLFYDRLISNQDITLFSPHEAKGLYEAFGDNEKFEQLYLKYENNKQLKFKKKIPARKLAEIYARERLETGRIYSMNIDIVNEHGSWDIPCKMSNLCVEVVHPTIPVKSIDDKDAEIGICILSALNLLELSGDKEIETACRIIVQSLESLIDYQDYPVVAGENFTKNRRSLGIGVTNLAGLLAKHKLKYGDPEALKLIHGLMEKIQWNLINASCDLAKEKGACAKFADTKYARGLMPIDWYKKTVDDLVKPVYNMDWEGLRLRVKQYGMRHSTLSAIMPCESSSVIQNSTNGDQPVRALLSHKKAKNGVLKQLVPNYQSKKNYYTLVWDLKDNKALLDTAAVMQKFVDMAMSTNLYYNYAHYQDGNIPLSVLIKDQIYGYKYGLKNFYYCNTPDADGETEKDMNCESGACAI
jgi:ribonucleoside-diphosphate reductase alpha chain